MSWVYLDDKFHSNPKVLAVDNDGAGLYARALSYCGDHLTDGFVPIAWARGAGSAKLRNKLVSHGVWDEVDGGYLIPDYLELNPSKAKVMKRRAERSAAGKRGADTRWGDGNSHSSSHSNSHDDEDGNSHSSANGSPHEPLHAPQPQPQPQFSIPPSAVKDAAPDRAQELDGFQLDPDKLGSLRRIVALMPTGHRKPATVKRLVAAAEKVAPAAVARTAEEAGSLGPEIRDVAGWAITRLRNLQGEKAPAPKLALEASPSLSALLDLADDSDDHEDIRQLAQGLDEQTLADIHHDTLQADADDRLHKTRAHYINGALVRARRKAGLA